MNEAQDDEFAKVVLVGPSFVGKTSIISRAFNNTFSSNVKPTIGSGFAKGVIQGNTKAVKLEVWDTAGQEMYQSLTPLFFTGSSVAVLVYDVTSRASFEQLGKYKTMLADNVPDHCLIIVAGNKVDLVDNDEGQREVSYDEADEYAAKIGAVFFCEVSALTGYGVDLLFGGIVDHPKLIVNSPHKCRITESAKRDKKKENGCCK